LQIKKKRRNTHGGRRKDKDEERLVETPPILRRKDRNVPFWGRKGRKARTGTYCWNTLTDHRT